MKCLIVNKAIFATGGIEEYIRQTVSGDYGDIAFTILAHEPKQQRASKKKIDAFTGADIVLAKIDTTIAHAPVSRDFIQKFKREAESADIIHVHMPFPPSAFAAWLFRKKLVNKKIVVTFHAVPEGKYFFKMLYRPFLNWLLKRADSIVVTSPVMQGHSDIVRFREKTTVIPCAAKDIGVGKHHDMSYVFAVGRLVPYKGFEYLINAMITTPYQLIIAGDGPLRTKLQKMIDAAGVAERIVLEGNVSDARLAFLYKHASIFVLPSVSNGEAFGIVQLEAMSAGLPIVNTDLPTGVPWVARDGQEAITVRPKSSKDLRDAIVRLITQKKERFTLGANARALA